MPAMIYNKKHDRPNYTNHRNHQTSSDRTVSNSLN